MYSVLGAVGGGGGGADYCCTLVAPVCTFISTHISNQLIDIT